MSRLTSARIHFFAMMVVPTLSQNLNIPIAMNLKSFDSPTQSQFGGTCSAFATAAAMNNVLKQKGIEKTVSERHLWSLYQRYDSDEAVQAASRNFVTDSSRWPTYGTRDPLYSEASFVRISETQHHAYDYRSALKGLAQGNPLVMAVRVPRSLSNCDPVVNPKSPRTRGHHVVMAVGYELDDALPGGGQFIIKNSWGPKCGDSGYQKYPFALCERSDLYCYFIEVKDVEVRSVEKMASREL